MPLADAETPALPPSTARPPTDARYLLAALAVAAHLLGVSLAAVGIVLLYFALAVVIAVVTLGQVRVFDWVGEAITPGLVAGFVTPLAAAVLAMDAGVRAWRGRPWARSLLKILLVPCPLLDLAGVTYDFSLPGPSYRLAVLLVVVAVGEVWILRALFTAPRAVIQGAARSP